MLQRRGHQIKMQNQHLQHQQQQQQQQQPTQHRQFPLMPPSSIYAQCSAVADGSSGGVGSSGGGQNSYAPAVLPSSNQSPPDFIYWQPPPQQQQQLQRDQIMVEQQQQQQQSGHVYGLPQQARPRMGLGPRMAPIHTSTPHLLLPVIAASPLRTTENNGEDDEEEPIYCEIARDSPEKTARLPTPAKNARSSAFLRRQQQVGVRRDVVTRRQAGDFTEVRVDNRKSCDFSPSPKRYQHLPPSARPLAPTKSGQISYRPGGGSGAMESDLLRGRLQLHPYSPPPLPLPTHGGLGRRAVTQLDFGRTQRNNPNNFAAAAAMAAPRLMQQQQYHGGSQYLNKRGGVGGGGRFAAAAAGEGGLMLGPYSSDSEFTAQRARRPHVLLHKEQPMMRMRRPSQKASSDFCGNASDCGFGASALDDTTSTAPTDLSVATSATGAHSTTSSLRNAATLRKGLMWQQRDKMFSRWKERFFILTSNYLQCFKKGTSRITEMGGFIFKLRLSEVEEVELIDKKGYLTISLSLVKEGKILLRKPEGIREWFQDLKDSVASCREKRSFMMPTKEFWSKKQFTDSSSMEQWILARRNIQAKYAYNGEAAGDDAQSLRHLKDVSKSNLNVARKNPVMTTDYGFIDMPPLPPSSQNCHGRGGEHEAEGGAAGNNLGDKSRIAADEDMIAGLTLDDTPSEASRSSVSPISSDFPMKNTSAVQCRIPKDSSSTFSHDSGVDSMNTNSSGSVLSSASNRPTPSMVAYRGSSAPSPATPVTANSKFGARNNVQRSNFRQNSAPPMAGGGARRPSKLPKPVSTPGKAENPKQHHISVV